MYTEDDFLSLSGIQHFRFCRRQWALIHIAQVWKENYLTFRGQVAHERAHDASRLETRNDLIISRVLKVHSYELGLSGECDVVEFHRSDEGARISGKPGYYQLIPIEYKSGSPKGNDIDEVQLIAQIICLEEMFQTDISFGYLYYKTTNKRVLVQTNAENRKLVKEMCQEMHQNFQRAHIPKVKKSKRCNSCSLKDHCFSTIFSKKSPESYIQSNVEELDENA
jgi:CRISPR-associated exonuclease Cas4